MVVVVRNSTAYPKCSEKSSGGQGSGCNHGAGNTTGDQGARGGGWTSEPPSTQFDY